MGQLIKDKDSEEMIEIIVEQKLLRNCLVILTRGYPLESRCVTGSCARNKPLQQVNAANHLKM